jgi:hypothetical protein
MNGNRKTSKRKKETIQPWTYEQALGVLPYLGSVVRSLREHRLEAVIRHREAKAIAGRPGRADRATIIAQEDAAKAARAADEQFEAALEELHQLDIYCLDPIRGEALVPFVHDNQLAWYIYDVFDEEPFRFWRYHSDPLEARRPIADAWNGPAGAAQAV